MCIQYAQADVSVTRINAKNASQWVQAGPDAIGGIGDWVISNGVLCALISDIPHENEFSTAGGVLTDLGFCARADDHLTTIQDMFDGERTRPIDISHIEMETGEGWASVITFSNNEGLEVKTRYTLYDNLPTQLKISKTLRIIDEDVVDFNLISSTWFNYHSLEVFVYSSNDAVQSRGFNNVDFNTRGISALSEAASSADTLILVSPPEAEYPIAYGWQLKSAKRITGEGEYPLPAFFITDEEATAMLVLADSFYVGDGSELGLLQLPQIPLLSLDRQDTIEIEQVITVGKRADVASVTDQLLAGSTKVFGQVASIDSAIHIMHKDGTPVTFIRPFKDGTFEFELTPGEYRLKHQGSASRFSEREFIVTDAVKDLGMLSLPKAAQLKLPRGNAMRLVFVGEGETADPDFENRLTNFSVASDNDEFHQPIISQIFLAGVDSDPAMVELEPGTYTVYATRGLEYSLSTTKLTVSADKVNDLVIDIPTHLIKTPGYISADLHVHSGVGFDNTFSQKSRVKTFVAEHGEVMVSSEHDVPVDFAPLIKEMEVDDKIASIAAVEITSIVPAQRTPFTGGHINFFPYTPEPYRYRKGTINHENRRLREILHDVEQKHPHAISQLNHARLSLKLSSEIPENYEDIIDYASYLEHMGVAGYPYNPSQPIHSHPNNTLIEQDPITGVRDIDVDAFEIINPGGVDHDDRIIALRKDWLSFLLQGIHMTGTANSDSHHAGQQVAVPRNMVAITDDSIAGFNQSEFLESIKSGNIYGTTGPMLEVSLHNDLESVSLGETYSGDSAQFKIRLQSANWIPVDLLSIQVNGEDVIDVNLTDERSADESKGVDIEYSVTLNFVKDSFVTVEVRGEASQEYKVIYPGLSPYAFTNPIYVDYDSDGKWQPPGLD